MSKIRRRKKKKSRSERRKARKAQVNWDVAACRSLPRNIGNYSAEQALSDRQRLFFHELNHTMFRSFRIKPIASHSRWCWNSFFGEKKKMNIAVIQEDGTENEFELEMCCPDCASRTYGWTSAQFERISKLTEPMKVPDNIRTEEEFKQFVKTL